MCAALQGSESPDKARAMLAAMLLLDASLPRPGLCPGLARIVLPVPGLQGSERVLERMVTSEGARSILSFKKPNNCRAEGTLSCSL
jgi:hypothetical protein